MRTNFANDERRKWKPKGRNKGSNIKNRELLQIKTCIIEVTLELATKGVFDFEYNGFFYCHGGLLRYSYDERIVRHSDLILFFICF